MRVLIGYAFSDTEREEFRKRGHDAWSCDLLPSESGSKYHIQGDIFDILDDGWDLGVFHPDCTYLTCSAAWAYGDGPYHQKVKPETLVGKDRRDARERALYEVRRLMESKIPRKAIENPAVNFINTRIRKPDQIIQPNQFGHNASKATGLWLENLPPLVPTKIIEPRWVCCGSVIDVEKVGKYGCPFCHGDKKPKPRWANQTDSGQNKLTPGPDRWKERSRTYQGWADAFADQWGNP